MKIRIISVGKLKEKYLVDGIKEYKKRLQGYCNVELIEVPDEKIPDQASLKEEAIIKQKEGQKILSKIKPDEYVILLDLAGKEIDSIELANKIESCMVYGKSIITFVIGGSLGHEKDIINRADFRLSFSKLTFPHQLIRLFLMEQIYRSFKIINHETYHK